MENEKSEAFEEFIKSEVFEEFIEFMKIRELERRFLDILDREESFNPRQICIALLGLGVYFVRYSALSDREEQDRFIGMIIKHADQRYEKLERKEKEDDEMT